MITNNRPVAVRVTHTPSGISAACTEERTERKAKEKAMNLLKSRLWAAGHLNLDQSEVTTYRLPDSDCYPRELDKYRITKKPGQGGE